MVNNKIARFYFCLNFASCRSDEEIRPINISSYGCVTSTASKRFRFDCNTVNQISILRDRVKKLSMFINCCVYKLSVTDTKYSIYQNNLFFFLQRLLRNGSQVC